MILLIGPLGTKCINRNSYILSKTNAFQSALYKIAAILYRPQHGKQGIANFMHIMPLRYNHAWKQRPISNTVYQLLLQNLIKLYVALTQYCKTDILFIRKLCSSIDCRACGSRIFKRCQLWATKSFVTTAQGPQWYVIDGIKFYNRGCIRPEGFKSSRASFHPKIGTHFAPASVSTKFLHLLTIIHTIILEHISRRRGQSYANFRGHCILKMAHAKPSVLNTELHEDNLWYTILTTKIKRHTNLWYAVSFGPHVWLCTV